ncbi:MAG: hypothetical protein KF739_02925 [Cryobacterium sp.]|nr:hypothetical protein [Cryobacterium sp.]
MNHQAHRAASGVLLGGLLAGCIVPATTKRGSSSADQTIPKVARADRGDSIVFGGPLDNGAAATAADWLGSVVVVNF